MNIISVSGNVARDIEIRHTPSGDAVGSFSVADNQGKDKPAIFWRCQLWGKRAESLAPYIKSGQSVTVAGQVTEREWTDKEGAQRKTMEIRVTDLALHGGRRDDAPRQASKPTPQKSHQAGDDFSDIPF